MTNNNAVFGEVDWNTASGGNSNFAQRKDWKDTFLQLQTGENTIRILTKPYQFLMHKVHKNEADKFGQRVLCSKIHGTCPVCDDPEYQSKAKPRWLIGVIDRKSGQYKILDIGWAILSQLQALNGTKWGSPEKYDLTLIKGAPGTPPANFYKVIPCLPEPLSAEEMVMKDNPENIEDLKRRVTPPTPDQVTKRLEKIFSDTDFKSAGNTTPSQKVVVKAPVVDMSSEDDEQDEVFPSYQ